MIWVTAIVIGGVVGGLAFLLVNAHARLGVLYNMAAGAGGSVVGAYCVATAASRDPGAALLGTTAIISAVLSLAFVRWVATPIPPAPLRRRR